MSGEELKAKETALTEESDGQRDLAKKKSPKRYVWPIKVTILTLILSAFFSFITEIISTKSNLVVALLICILLVVISIIFDGIGVSVTNCDIKPLTAMASRRVPASRRAIKLVQNAEKVSSICCDVIGDICGIVSGACSAVIVLKIVENAGGDKFQLLFSIICSAVIAALTVGGKAFEKTVAIKNSKEMVLFTARIICFFTQEDKKGKKNASKKVKSSK